jgi:hypothetical protein
MTPSEKNIFYSAVVGYLFEYKQDIQRKYEEKYGLFDAAVAVSNALDYAILKRDNIPDLISPSELPTKTRSVYNVIVNVVQDIYKEKPEYVVVLSKKGENIINANGIDESFFIKKNNNLIMNKIPSADQINQETLKNITNKDSLSNQTKIISNIIK